MGDEWIRYDKVGNITGMRRHHYYDPTQPLLPGTRKGDNWEYVYAQGTNRLSRIRTGATNEAQFQYDPNGALTSDTRRAVSVFQSELSGLPTVLTGQGGSIHTSTTAQCGAMVMVKVGGLTRQYGLPGNRYRSGNTIYAALRAR